MTVEKTGTASGLTYAVVSPGTGYRCGYVAVPKTHSLFEIDYSAAECDFGVHGGLTFSGYRKLPESPGLWWFGFDCAHCDDAPDPALNPDIARLSGLLAEGHVWTTDEVAAECERLAEQLSRH